MQTKARVMSNGKVVENRHQSWANAYVSSALEYRLLLGFFYALSIISCSCSWSLVFFSLSSLSCSHVCVYVCGWLCEKPLWLWLWSWSSVCRYTFNLMFIVLHSLTIRFMLKQELAVSLWKALFWICHTLYWICIRLQSYYVWSSETLVKLLPSVRIYLLSPFLLYEICFYLGQFTFDGLTIPLMRSMGYLWQILTPVIIR